MKKPIYIYKSSIVLYTILLLVSGCSTKKNTPITRTYHAITSKYNIYFNGYESFKSGLNRLDENFVDDYTKILPIFKYPSEELAGLITTDMDMSISKSSKVITLHSIKAKPKYKNGPQSMKEKEFYKKNEYNKWIDDCYLLTGKAHFYKRDYFLARETFNFILKEFPEETFTKYTALIWLAKAYIELQEFKDCEQILLNLENATDFPEKFNALFYATYADYYLKQEQYNETIPKLESALALIRKKNTKIRFSYILAQLYQETGALDKANEMYGKVLKMNPPYEIVFNAKINRAGVFQISAGNANEIRNQLLKMLKDEKNLEYQDQIYYALGNISIKENDITKAIYYYQLSARSSVNNTLQKTTSYLTIADIYYNMPDYTKAAAYYDSAVVLLSPEHENYKEVIDKSTNLNRLVNNLYTITLEDSLQRLAKLSEKDLLAHIDKIIENVTQKELEEKKLQQERMQDDMWNRMMLSDNTSSTRTVNQPGKWYFYNPAAKSYGQREFTMKWGKRQLADDWRRKNKKAIDAADDLTAESEQGTFKEEKKNKIMNNKTREYYLQDIPNNDSLLEISHTKIKEAFYNVGIIYKNNLNDPELAIKAFEDLLTRYPENEYQLAAYYNLYNLYKNKNNEGKAIYYKNLIVTKYPDSHFANLLDNPNYLKELEEKEREIYRLYETTYELYKSGNYIAVMQNADYAKKQYKNHEILPKFAYLKTLSIGGTKDVNTFRDSLSNFVAKYPDSEIKFEAENVIAYIDNKFPKIKELKEIEKAEVTYMPELDTIHFYGIAFKGSEASLNQLIFNIINFNLDNTSEAELNVNGESLDNEYYIVVVKSFINHEEAFNYYNMLSNNKEILKDVDISEFYKFIISIDNYNILIKDKSISRYMYYFQNNYLK